MFLLRKLKKWLELEIKELTILEDDWNKRGCKDNANACYHQRDALEGVLYILDNKGVWHDGICHGIFKQK